MAKRKAERPNSIEEAKRLTIKELKEKRRDLLEMTQSKGWEVWLDWARTTKDALRDIALRDTDAAVREEARMEYLAFEKFERLPAFLVQLTQEG